LSVKGHNGHKGKNLWQRIGIKNKDFVTVVMTFRRNRQAKPRKVIISKVHGSIGSHSGDAMPGGEDSLRSKYGIIPYLGEDGDTTPGGEDSSLSTIASAGWRVKGRPAERALVGGTLIEAKEGRERAHGRWRDG